MRRKKSSDENIANLTVAAQCVALQKWVHMGGCCCDGKSELQAGVHDQTSLSGRFKQIGITSPSGRQKPSHLYVQQIMSVFAE